MSDRQQYEAALEEVRRRLGSGYAVVPIYPDMKMVAAALDQYDHKGSEQSYTDIFAVMVDNYVKRKGDEQTTSLRGEK